jgi:hypothetical protein
MKRKCESVYVIIWYHGCLAEKLAETKAAFSLALALSRNLNVLTQCRKPA